MKSSPSHAKPATCEKVRSYLPLLSSNALSRAFSAELRLHVSRCFECTDLLESLQAVDESLRRWIACSPPLRAGLTFDDLLPLEPVQQAKPSRPQTALPQLPAPVPSRQHERRRDIVEQAHRQPAPHVQTVSFCESALHTCDDSQTQHEEGYSPLVAEQLTIIYHRITRAVAEHTPVADVYAQSYNTLFAYMSFPMSDRQRLRIQYHLALSQRALGNAEAAFATVGAALDIAEKLDDVHALAECAYLGGVLLAELGDNDTAAEYLEGAIEALAILQTRSESPNTLDPALEDLILEALKALVALPPPVGYSPPNPLSGGSMYV